MLLKKLNSPDLQEESSYLEIQRYCEPGKKNGILNPGVPSFVVLWPSFGILIKARQGMQIGMSNSLNGSQEGRWSALHTLNLPHK